MTDEEFVQWKAELEQAIGGTFEQFKAYSIKMGQVPSSPQAFEIMYHKCRTAILSLPYEVREASHIWLTERGYRSWFA